MESEIGSLKNSGGKEHIPTPNKDAAYGDNKNKDELVRKLDKIYLYFVFRRKKYTLSLDFFLCPKINFLVKRAYLNFYNILIFCRYLS